MVEVGQVNEQLLSLLELKHIGLLRVILEPACRASFE